MEDEKVRKEVKRLRSDMDELHVVHSKLSGEIKRLQDCHGRDQAKIKRLTGQHLGAALGANCCPLVPLPRNWGKKSWNAFCAGVGINF
jgi:hypothetical protein